MTTATARKTPATAKSAKKTHPKSALPKPAAVLAYLQANPTFFDKHADQLAETIAKPHKKKLGGNILSLHAAKASHIARDAENLKIRHQQLISTARGNAEIAENIFSVIITLINCRTLTALRKYLQTGMTDHLQLEAVRLFKVGPEETATTLTADQITTLCPQPLVVGPLHASTHRPLFGPKTNGLKSVCLMALTNEEGVIQGLLALGSANETRFHAGQATTLADFLRRAVGSVLTHAA